MIYPEKNIILDTEAENALKKAREYSAGFKHIVVTGSFYMASEIKKLL
jgi:folylpolyglutamate synthase/dihydropteroate synthase